MKRGIRVWLARDSYKDDIGHYSVCGTKPKLTGSGVNEMWSGEIDCFCASDFERITGYKLEPGECKRVRIHIEECT